MNRQEAKFLLHSYRPNGADALDPVFAEALSLIRTDPELARWFAMQSRFDREVARHLQAVYQSGELLGHICARMRVEKTGLRISRWWLAVAIIVVFSALAATAEFIFGQGENPANGLSP